VKQIETQTGTNSILKSVYVFLVFILLFGICLCLFQCYINKVLFGIGYHESLMIIDQPFFLVLKSALQNEFQI
jgi:hypothetical protein